MQPQWKRPEFWLYLVAIAITMTMAAIPQLRTGTVGAVLLIALALLKAIGIQASDVSVNNAYLTPAPGQAPEPEPAKPPPPPMAAA